MSFGIDFGTTNSVLAEFDGKGTRPIPLDKWNLDDWNYKSFDKLFPTVVGYSSTRPERLFGWEAKLRSEESVAAVKRLLKGDEKVKLADREYSAPTVVAGFFDALRKRARGEGRSVARAVVTVPANATGAARFRTRAAARLGGVQVQALLNEPTAAAIAYVDDLERLALEEGALESILPERILVFDWGGGTVDVTVLQYDAEFGLFAEQATSGITELGGIELDARLERLVLRKIGGNPGWSDSELRQFRREIERTKIQLSTEKFAAVTTPDYAKTVGVEREEFEAEITDLVERSSEPLRACLATLNMLPDELDAVLMIGGSSQIPLVRTLVENILDTDTVNPLICDPMTAVARGAAIAAAILDGEVKSTLSVAATHALGTVITDSDGKRSFNKIIPRNAALPAVQTKLYRPSRPGQPKVTIEVWEGDEEKPLDDPENFLLGKITIPLPENRTQDQNEFYLTYTYDTDGLLHVQAETIDHHLLLDEDVDKFGTQESGAAVTSESLQEFLEAFRTAAQTRGQPTVDVTVNDKPYRFDREVVTGREMKARASIPESDWLYLRRPGGNNPIAYDEEVTLHEGDVFFSRPRSNMS